MQYVFSNTHWLVKKLRVSGLFCISSTHFLLTSLSIVTGNAQQGWKYKLHWIVTIIHFDHYLIGLVNRWGFGTVLFHWDGDCKRLEVYKLYVANAFKLYQNYYNKYKYEKYFCNLFHVWFDMSIFSTQLWCWFIFTQLYLYLKSHMILVNIKNNIWI